MALPVIPKATYPNVPNAPGVPALLRQAANIQNEVVLLVADAAQIAGLFQPAQWGLFTADGSPFYQGSSGGFIAQVLAVLAGGTSVAELEYRQDTRVSSAPQEAGAFLSYNKVATPFSGRVTYIISGSDAQRGAFLSAVETWEASTDLLTMVMPEKFYANCTVVHHDFRRTAARGLTMFAVDIWVEEVRITATTAYTNTQKPDGAAQANVGAVQATDALPAQAAGLPAGGPY